MSIQPVLPVWSAAECEEVVRDLKAAGIAMVAGTVCNLAGIYLAKTVAPDRLSSFAGAGLGASPTWNVFCIDGGIAFTPDLGVIGDMRLRLDLDALRQLGGGLAWAPAEIFDQNGRALEIDTRGRLRRIQRQLEDSGLQALVGIELEFTLTAADGSAFERPGWTPYGLGPILDHESFIADLTREAAEAGIPLEQVHAEFAAAQFELALAPATPLAAADDAVLARLLVCRLARTHGLRASFSPFPFAGGGGNGAHVHFSLSRSGSPLFSGGVGPYGITPDGGSAIAGIVAELPGLEGVLAGSILSGARLRPGYWSGAYACWGRENREASVRYLEATPGNPRGANVEVKIVDPSANPYLAAAAILGAALRGIQSALPLPGEVTANPADQSAEQCTTTSTRLLPVELGAVLDELEASTAATQILGPDIVQAAIAVRRHELSNYGAVTADELAEKFRFAWSI
ncbi:MAG: glutamine synthetase family protein [Microbacteriaceae bacterium]